MVVFGCTGRRLEAQDTDKPTNHSLERLEHGVDADGSEALETDGSMCFTAQILRS